MNTTKTTSNTVTATRSFNGLRYALECNLIEVYNLMEVWWSPEYEQFKWLA